MRKFFESPIVWLGSILFRPITRRLDQLIDDRTIIMAQLDTLKQQVVTLTAVAQQVAVAVQALKDQLVNVVPASEIQLVSESLDPVIAQLTALVTPPQS